MDRIVEWRVSALPVGDWACMLDGSYEIPADVWNTRSGTRYAVTLVVGPRDVRSLEEKLGVKSQPNKRLGECDISPDRLYWIEAFLSHACRYAGIREGRATRLKTEVTNRIQLGSFPLFLD